ncbi:hypothetical protein B7P43_G03239 [Cryptotermes secundus]|uniref:Uncharacterized protein n=1 Tax=Cryptotermes secundus TaxID=105785 RepID=A0A2J7Q6B6_9NEOP|nr:hypothetical protein B7P43_G03239 [Cryptotermes secundus]
MAVEREFCLLHSVQTAMRPTQPLIQWVPGAPFPGIKQLGSEAEHSPPANSAELMNT